MILTQENSLCSKTTNTLDTSTQWRRQKFLGGSHIDVTIYSRRVTRSHTHTYTHVFIDILGGGVTEGALELGVGSGEGGWLTLLRASPLPTYMKIEVKMAGMITAGLNTLSTSWAQGRQKLVGAS